MYHHPKPFFRKARQQWYVEIDGRQFKLGPDKEAALELYHELMQHREDPSVFLTNDVASIIDAYLDWCQNYRSPKTYEWYRYRLALFVKRYQRLPAAELKPFHVQQWVDSYQHLAPGSKRNYMRAIQRAMKWAEQQGYIDRSPISHIEKPPQGRRQTIITPAEFQEILGHVSMREARDLLTVAWETGCRAQEILRVEARHVELANGRWVFPLEETKTKKVPRLIYLTPTSQEITERLMQLYPTGKLFRNSQGRPWQPAAVNCLFERLRKKVGKKYCLTVLRHSWCTHALTNGVDALTVSILMGHADPSMIDRVYSHLSHVPQYLAEQAQKAIS